ncbi:MAG: zinc ribbon domain-containing protein [Anaerolineae bacterium]|nr:zinc ribbon domain-containing protein [Anaerolineae bacterium]
MFKRITLLAFLLIILTFGAAQAQEAVNLSFLQVDLWPEYDRPEVLVIYRIQLASDLTLPQDVTFRIPASVGEPHAVAFQQPGGSLLTANYTRRVDGEWALITVTASTPNIQIEYYDSTLEKTASDRHYQFTWTSEYAVDEMIVKVQQPPTATNISVEPDLGSFQAGPDGLTYYDLKIGAISTGDAVSVKLDYQKDNDLLSIENFDVSAPIQGETSNQVDASMTDWLPWILGALGLVLVVGSIGWYWQTTRQNEPERKSTHRGRRSSSPSQSPSEAGSTFHCHQCGKRAAKNDRFCRVCGTKLHHS